MGIFNGLRGGEAMYLSAPFMQYEKLQRPEELKLPAMGRKQTKTDANKYNYNYLPSDAANISMLESRRDNLLSKVDSGNISEAEAMELNQLETVILPYNHMQAKWNYEQGSKAYQSDEFRDKLDTPLFDERGGFQKGEDGRILTVQDGINNEISRNRRQKNGMLDFLNLDNIGYDIEDFDKIVNDSFDNVGSTQTAGLNDMNSQFENASGYLEGKHIISNIKQIAKNNNGQLNKAHMSFIQRVFSNPKAYRSAKIQLHEKMKRGEYFGEHLISEEEKKAKLENWDGKSDDVRKVKMKNAKGQEIDYYQFKYSEDDLLPLINERADLEVGKRHEKLFDIDRYINMQGDGKTKEEDRLRELYLFANNDPMVEDLGRKIEIDIGYVLRNNLNLERYPADQKELVLSVKNLQNEWRSIISNPSNKIPSEYGFPEGKSWYDAALDIYIEQNADKNLKKENLSAEQKEVAINNLITKQTIQGIKELKQFEDYLDKKYNAQGERTKTFDGVSVHYSGQPKKSKDSVAASIISGLSKDDYIRYGDQIKTYKITKDQLDGTYFENGYSKVGRPVDGKVSVLGTSQENLLPEHFGGKQPVFMIGDTWVSNLPIDGERTFAAEGYLVINGSSKKYLEQISVKGFRDENGKDQVNLRDYKIDRFSILKSKVDEKFLAANPNSGYSLGDYIYLIPAAMDARQAISTSKKMFDIKARNTESRLAQARKSTIENIGDELESTGE